MTSNPQARLQPRLFSRRSMLFTLGTWSTASGARAEDTAAELQIQKPGSTMVPGQRLTTELVHLLFVGDSLAQGLFLTLQPALRRRDTVRVTNGTQHATGITRSDEHDWPTVTRDLVTRHRPDLVVFWIGANDFRPLVLRETRSRFQFGTSAFAEHYGNRVGQMVSAVMSRNARSIWLGLPNMRDAQFASAVRILNEVQEAASTTIGAVFVPTWQATSDGEGRYMPSLESERGRRPLRVEVGVHFTDLGYRHVAGLIFETVATRFPELSIAFGRGVET